MDLVKWTLAKRHSPWRNPMGVTRNELYTRCLTWEGNETRQNGVLKGMPPSVPFLSPTLPPPRPFPPRHRFCPLLLLTLFPIAENVYDAPLGFRLRNPVDVPTRACILDKMLRAFTYITSNVERPDIYRDTWIKWIKLASQKWHTLFM